MRWPCGDAGYLRVGRVSKRFETFFQRLAGRVGLDDVVLRVVSFVSREAGHVEHPPLSPGGPSTHVSVKQ